MSEYRRLFVPGGTFFFTVVTANRLPLFADAAARNLLGSVLRRCLARLPARVIAMVLLPDHLHTMWAMPPGDTDYSSRWKWIKREFTIEWLAIAGAQQPAGNRERRRSVWQRRFWEHTIRNESDWEAHFDYIHFNPVNHALVQAPCDWPWSTFHRWVRAGHYTISWGRAVDESLLPGCAGE